VTAPGITVLCGGTSGEREISLGSGRAVAQAMARHFPTRVLTVENDSLPAGLDPDEHVVFSTLHGLFGEDGGSDLCVNKWRARQSVSAMGVQVAPGRCFTAGTKPSAAELVSALGPHVVLKPNRQGSSLGLEIVSGPEALGTALAGIREGEWLAEQRIVGRELTVGILRGRAMGVVEIVPKSGVFDYSSKYTKGLTEYFSPARLPAEVADHTRQVAEAAFGACGCRDYARVDFMLSEEGGLYLLEINTLPGMKETSLLPMSARSFGLDFGALCRELVAPALERFQHRHVTTI
jgi:D-alanine-D-alanine ligase